jgi:hypothetical protein
MPLFGASKKPAPPSAASAASRGTARPLHLLQYDEATKKFELGEAGGCTS